MLQVTCWCLQQEWCSQSASKDRQVAATGLVLAVTTVGSVQEVTCLDQSKAAPEVFSVDTVIASVYIRTGGYFFIKRRTSRLFSMEKMFLSILDQHPQEFDLIG